MSQVIHTIRVDNETDRWKWVCPQGHRNWEPINNHFWCQSCAQFWRETVEPEFDELVNMQTDETVPRDQIRLVRSPDSKPRGVR